MARYINPYFHPSLTADYFAPGASGSSLPIPDASRTRSVAKRSSGNVLDKPPSTVKVKVRQIRFPENWNQMRDNLAT